MYCDEEEQWDLIAQSEESQFEETYQTNFED